MASNTKKESTSIKLLPARVNNSSLTSYKLTESEIQIIYELNQKGYSLREIASQMNCSKSTVDNYLKKAKRRGIPE